MAVPNTNTFSFQDVCTEIYGYYAAAMNLSQAFTDAIGTFDPTYVGSKNGLLCFRNYVHSSIPNDVRLILHTVAVNTNTAKLDWEFVIQNGTASNCNTSVRIMNVTKSSPWMTIKSTTVYAHTDSGVLNGLTLSMLITNAIGDYFNIQLSLDSGSTWTGVLEAGNPLTLNYDWTF